MEDAPEYPDSYVRRREFEQKFHTLGKASHRVCREIKRIHSTFCRSHCCNGEHLEADAAKLVKGSS